MPPRVSSPFDPGKRAVVEPIVQPLYSRVTMAAVPERTLQFFATTRGTAGFTPRDTNMDVAGVLASPKIFVILGVRLHYDEDAGASFDFNTQVRDVVSIAHRYWYEMIIGTKTYLEVPAFYLSSGLGAFATAHGGAAVDQHVGQMGWPTWHSHFKNDRHPITIPPQQSFRTVLNQGVVLAALARARDIWNILEGDFGREVQ